MKKTESKRSSAFWLKRLRNPKIVTLTGIAPQVKVEDNCLILQNGITVGEIEPKPTIYGKAAHGLQWVIIDSFNGIVTIDALRWMHSQGIGIMIISDGISQILHDVEKPIVSLRRIQYTTDTLKLSQYILKGKFENQLSNFPDLPNAEVIRLLIAGGITDYPDIQSLMLLKGRIARDYWKYQAFTLRAFKKFPLWWQEFTTRSNGINAPSNRHATHPINAILNYGYAVTAGMIKLHAVIAGLDVACGSLHADNDRRDSLIYDLLELLRADIDKLLLGWAKTVTWRRTDFVVDVQGVVSLEPNLKRVVAEKVIKLDSKSSKIVRKYVLLLLTIDYNHGLR